MSVETVATEVVTPQIPFVSPEIGYAQRVDDRFIAPKFKVSLLVLPAEELDSRASPGVVTEDLKNSISANGIETPLLITPLEDGTFQIIDGRRRYKAAKELGLTEVPAFAQLVRGKNEVLRKAGTRNMHQQTLSTYDMAVTIERHVALGDRPADVAKAYGLSDSYVSQYRGVLKLPQVTQEAIRRGELEPGTFTKARALQRLKENEGYQVILTEVAKVVKSETITEIVAAVLKAKEYGFTQDLVELILTGDLEQDSTDKVEALNKVKDVDERTKMAKQAAKKNASAADIEEWIVEAKRATRGTEKVKDEAVEYDGRPVKPLKADKLLTMIEAAEEKTHELTKMKEPTAAQMRQLWISEGYVQGLRHAGSLPRVARVEVEG